MLPTRGFMFDTCTINRIFDQKVSADEWRLRGPIYVTDIQISEIAQTPDRVRRESLLATLFALTPSVVRPGSPRLHTYDFGSGDDDAHDEQQCLGSHELSLGRQVPIMAAMLGRSPAKFENRFRDALITEATRTNRLILVTADKGLAKMATRFGVCVEGVQ